MSEAEKSVATKKKVAVTRPMNRNDSPVEYSPKRKQPSGSGKRASPPPYIPSKKMRSDEISQEQSTRSVKQKRTLSKDDVRHTLGRDSSHRGRIISASRKEELLKAMGISKAKVASGVPSLTHGPTRKIEAGSDTIKGNSDRTTEGGSYARQVRGEDAQAGGIKNLQITARVGPMRAIQRASSDAQKSSLSPELSKASLQFTIVAGHSKSKKGGGKDEPETASERSVQRDAREDIQAARKGKAVSAPAYKAGGRVLTKLARDAVQKQCQAAVMSVKKMPVPASKSKSARHESPDSRVVRCDRESPVDAGTDVLEDEDSNDATEVVLDTDSDRAASADSEPSKKVSVVQRKSPSSEPESLTELASLEEEKADMDVEDLSHMLEGEDLDSQLLLKEEEDKNDLNLDLDDEDLSHVVDDVNVSIEEEGAQSKSSTRFIVTLDGVDVAQFEEDNSGKSVPAIAEPQAQPTFLPPPNPSNPLPVATLMPNSSSRPAVAIANPHPQRLAHTLLQPVAHTVPQPLPQILPQPLAQPLPLAPIQASSAPSQVATKPRPPKIQPFSISLRDSDDEHEEKIVTYVQAGDITAAGSVSVTDDAGDDLTSLQRARQQERCRFWPACMAGTECQYHHPTTHCKTFPNCKFGDKCLFIHPNCRFDSKCVRPDCPFTHSSKRRLPQAVVTTIHAPRHYPRFPPVAPQAATVCHYFPNCLNPSCTFVHPKPCMYGASCKNPGCAFFHPVVQSANVGNLKWQAQVSSQSVVNKSSTPGTKTTTVSS